MRCGAGTIAGVLGEVMPPPALGERIGGFRLLALLGQGGMGRVYLALDEALGRRVALKLIAAAKADADRVARFLEEARATARLSHPNIVGIHALGEHAGQPFMALEYVEGETLAARIAEQVPGRRAALRIVHDIAEALAAAHAAGIAHLDLKPDNVVVGRDGRPRVLDFGLAQVLERSEASGSGTPRYMAPEQWRREVPGAAADIWALGVLLHELCLGWRPYGDLGASSSALRQAVSSPEAVPLRESGDAALDALLAACLQKAPEARPAAAAVVAKLSALLGELGAVTPSDAPFRGLHAFRRDHAAQFFGREREIFEALEALRESPRLAVIGASGVGKSSFLHAGLVPRLLERAPYALISLRPGPRPFEALAEALRGSSVGTQTLDESQLGEPSAGAPRLPADGSAQARWLREEPARFGVELQLRAQQSQRPILLVVDQLEELHTLHSDPAARRALRDDFLSAIAGVAQSAAEPLRVLVSLRDDFLGRLSSAGAPELGRLMLLRPPSRAALIEVLRQPLAQRDYRFDDPALVGEMVDAVVNEQASLPLLQFTALRLWEARDVEQRCLRRESFEALGGVSGALAGYADAVLAALPPGELDVAREILLRLVTAERTRRVIDRARLLDGAGPGAEHVLETLLAARLLTLRRREERDDAADLELVHESLVRDWARLRAWLDAADERLRLRAELEEAAALWHRRGRPAGEVWSGSELLRAEGILQHESAPGAGSEARAFVAAGRARQRRQTTLRRAVAAGLLVLTVLSLVAALAFSRVADRARRGESEARRAQARAEVQAARLAFDRGQILEARGRLRRGLEGFDLPEGRMLWARVRQRALAWSAPIGTVVHDTAFSPDGARLAIAAMDHTVQVFDVQSSERQVLRGLGDQILATAFSPDGAALAALTWDGRLAVYAVAEGRVRWTPIALGPGAKRSVVWCDEGRVAAGTLAGEVVVIDAGAGEVLHRLALGGGGVTATAAGGGSLVATSASSAAAWRCADGRKLLDLPGVAAPIAMSASGELLASGAPQLQLRRLPSGAVQELPPSLRELTAHRLQFRADGALLMAQPSGPLLRFRPGEDAARPLHGHHGKVDAISRDGRRVALSVGGAALRLITVEEASKRRVRPPDGALYSVAFSRDGQRLYAGGYGELLAFDVSSPQPQWRESFSGAGPAGALPRSTDTVFFAAAGRLEHRRGRSGALGRSVTIAPGWHQAIVGDAKADVVVISTGHNTDRGLELRDGPGAQVRRWRRPLTVDSGGLALTPDGTGVWLGDGAGQLKLYGVGSGEVRLTLAAHQGHARGIAIAEDGTLYSGGFDGRLLRWKAPQRAGDTPELLHRFDARITQIALHPGAAQLAVALAAPDAALFALPERTLQWMRGHRGEVNAITYAPGGGQVATVSDDATLRLWRSDDAAPVWRGPAPEALDAWDAAPVGLTRWISVDGGRALGFADGAVELQGAGFALRLASVPGAGVTALREAPGGALAVGFADGRFGVWSLSDGAPMLRSQIHGAVTRLELRENPVALEAMSDLGDSETLDLSVLTRPWCALLETLQAEVPRVWEDGRSRRRGLPVNHACVR